MKALSLFFFMLFSVLTLAQNQSSVIDAFWKDSLRIYESRLVVVGDSMINSQSQFTRGESAKQMIKVFRQALQIPGSYSYPFDSLVFISKLRPQDDAFRIFTWVLKLEGGKYRYFGVIHMNDPLRFVYHPLFDRSTNEMPTLHGEAGPNDGLVDSLYDNRNWFGMHYYDIAMVKKKKLFGLKGEKYYVLTGWDGNNNISHKKIIDVLTFNNGVPIFGAPIFEKDGELHSRVILEFNAQAVITLKYHDEEAVISFDHLVPPAPKNEGHYFTYLPSGQYDYYIWVKDHFEFREDYFNSYKKQLLGSH